MTDSRQCHWDGVYETRAEDEVSWFEVTPGASLDLIRRTNVPLDAAIIDVGGGLSHLAGTLVANGYSDVTVLDISDVAIRQLAARHQAVKGLVADITDWTPKRRYQVWHDRAVLHFLTDEADRAAYRRALLAGLEPGGQAIIATFAPTGPDRCSGLPVRRYGREDLEAFLGDAFLMVESFEFDHVTPAGRVQRFHVGRLRRKK
ncbi:MAG: class I SAM-dependent methyltransferase [Caulobacter sp.]|nr:class I SAM-dependent methyltransferase [Caulobacter sp.]